jgi:lambda family phage portal protein
VAEHSTIRTTKDGATSRWNPIVGRWETSHPGPRVVEQSSARALSTATNAAVPGMLPFKHAKRMYAAARNTRTTTGFGSSGNSSADAELSTGLTQLRARSRQMVRDSAYAKRAKLVVVNNVIGTGVGMQAQVMTTRGGLAQAVNDGIEQAWCEWIDASRCHTGGALHFHDIERAAMGQVFEAGECFIRKHYFASGDSRIPLSLELIEPERLANELVDPGALSTDPNVEVRMGVEVDQFGRALAYWVRQKHPGDIRGRIGGTDRYERVPAADMFHLRIVDRWPQTRGEPWLHTVLRKIDEMNEYTGSEVSAARASSYYFATIKTPDDDRPHADHEEDESGVATIEPLTIQELKPGEELEFHTPNRPNASLDPFMRHMLREVAAGCGVSYESLSRDYSQSNYSSSRLALLDDRDMWKVVQQWWIRNFRRPLHRSWMQQAVLARAIPAVAPQQYALDAVKFESVLFKPRGWSWVDPTKEVNAYKEAIKAGLTTITDVIAATAGGLDIEDVIATRKRELQMLKDAGIDVDTTVVPEQPVAPVQPQPIPGEEDGEGDTTDRSARVVNLRGAQ